ncbi:MAG: hypothetical protein GTO03_18410 [Planctomycetales bacterium]|nr:hypothetical protein [Planctomycetales bacterium]
MTSTRLLFRSVLTASLAATALLVSVAAAPPSGGEFRLSVVDQQTGKPLACRIHLANPRGLPQKAPRQPFLKDHFVFDGSVTLALREGNYRFVAECGPEYQTRVGHFTVNRFASDQKTISMRRFVDMAKEGWWSGDMYVNRDLRQLELLMRAEDLHVAQQLTSLNAAQRRRRDPQDGAALVALDDSRFYGPRASRDVRAGGGLCYFPLAEVPPLLAGEEPREAEAASAIQLARQLRASGEVWIEADTTGAWDLPVWIAHDLLDSVRLADQRFGRQRFFPEKMGQRPPEGAIYEGPRGAGRWAEHVYYQLLNCGFRIPPTAGSGSGDVPNPPGHNRVYVYCGEYFSYAKWWEALRAGRVVVTNGPLLRPSVEGHPPGHVFRTDAGTVRRLQIDLQLATKDKIEYLELIQNGELAATVRLEDDAGREGRLPFLEFDASGWFLVRAVTEAAGTYRFATSGPYYVEIGPAPRCSRRAAEFFQAWVAQRQAQITKMGKAAPRGAIEEQRRAEAFWSQRVEMANAD